MTPSKALANSCFNTDSNKDNTPLDKIARLRFLTEQRRVREASNAATPRSAVRSAYFSPRNATLDQPQKTPSDLLLHFRYTNQDRDSVSLRPQSGSLFVPNNNYRRGHGTFAATPSISLRSRKGPLPRIAPSSNRSTSNKARSQTRPDDQKAIFAARTKDFGRFSNPYLISSSPEIQGSTLKESDIIEEKLPTDSSKHSSTPRVAVPVNFAKCSFSAQQTTSLIPILVLDFSMRGLFAFSHFNQMQSELFPLIYQSDKNSIVLAPTGSGKTVLFELAILRFLSLHRNENMHALLLAPTRALCSQLYANWRPRFASLNLTVGLLTSETTLIDIQRVKSCNIVIATPEKWDSLSRAKADTAIQLDLLLVDEVHTVGCERGALLEVLVLRTKKRCPQVRIIALSATISNIEQAALWIGQAGDNKNPAAKLQYGALYRPVQIERFVWGCGRKTNLFRFDSSLNKNIIDVLRAHANKKPCLVFCSTRKICVSTAQYLLKNGTDLFLIGRKSPQIQDATLAQLVEHGIAFHHAGLSLRDRGRIEDGFSTGRIQVICCTSTLAVGVNLPAYLVVIKGTTCWKDGACSEYSKTDLLQMVGRAGRPQFGHIGKAVIMTSQGDVKRYQLLLGDSEIIDSCLTASLPEFLTVEIFLQFIKTREDAFDWLRSTFLFQCFLVNPSRYPQIRRSGEPAAEQVYDYLGEQIKRLCDDGFVLLQGDELQCSLYGAIMVRHSIRYDTVLNLIRMRGPLSLGQFLVVISKSVEFESISAKALEQKCLVAIARAAHGFHNCDPHITSSDKVCLLILCDLESISTAEYEGSERIAASLECEKLAVAKHFHRILKGLVDLCKVKADTSCLLLCNSFLRSFKCKCLEDTECELAQIPHLSSETRKMLVQNGVTTLRDVKSMTDAKLSAICGTQFHVVSRYLASLPTVTVKIGHRKVKNTARITKLEITIDLGKCGTARLFNGTSLSVTVITCTTSLELIDYRQIISSALDDQGRKTFTVGIQHLSDPIAVECHAAVDAICSAPTVVKFCVPKCDEACNQRSNPYATIHNVDELSDPIESDLWAFSLTPPDIMIEPEWPQLYLMDGDSRFEPGNDFENECLVSQLQDCRSQVEGNSRKRIFEGYNPDIEYPQSCSSALTYTPTPSVAIKRYKKREQATEHDAPATSFFDPRGKNASIPYSLRTPVTPLNTIPPDICSIASTTSSKKWKVTELCESGLKIAGRMYQIGRKKFDADPRESESRRTSFLSAPSHSK